MEVDASHDVAKMEHGLDHPPMMDKKFRVGTIGTVDVVILMCGQASRLRSVWTEACPAASCSIMRSPDRMATNRYESSDRLEHGKKTDRILCSTDVLNFPKASSEGTSKNVCLQLLGVENNYIS